MHVHSTNVYNNPLDITPLFDENFSINKCKINRICEDFELEQVMNNPKLREEFSLNPVTRARLISLNSNNKLNDLPNIDSPEHFVSVHAELSEDVFLYYL